MLHLFCLAALLSDGDLASIFNSPFVIPVAGTLMVLGIVVAGIWSGVRTREMQSQERLAMIAKGLPPESSLMETLLRDATAVTGPGVHPLRRPSDGAGARRAGIVLTSIGFGLIGFFSALAAILRERDILTGAATGLFPLAIGVGFLIDARLRKVELDRLYGIRSETNPLLPPSDIGALAPHHDRRA